MIHCRLKIFGKRRVMLGSPQLCRNSTPFLIQLHSARHGDVGPRFPAFQLPGQVLSEVYQSKAANWHVGNPLFNDHPSSLIMDCGVPI